MCASSLVALTQRVGGLKDEQRGVQKISYKIYWNYNVTVRSDGASLQEKSP